MAVNLKIVKGTYRSRERRMKAYNLGTIQKVPRARRRRMRPTTSLGGWRRSGASHILGLWL